MMANLVSKPHRATLLLDQSYGPQGGEFAEANSLDLYVPEGPGSFPLIVWIHGGGWHSGNKDIDFATAYLREGFAFASLNYRLTRNGHPFPAQIQDCSEALLWLFRHAEDHRIDTKRIGLLGHSAGAHLAALLAMNEGQFPFAMAERIPVQASVLWSLPADLARERGDWPPNTFVWNPRDLFCQTFFPGGAYEEDFANWASPMSYLNKHAAPLLIVHAEQDTLVPIEPTRSFTERLGDLGVSATFRPIPNAGHSIITDSLHTEAIAFFRACFSGDKGAVTKTIA